MSFFDKSDLIEIIIYNKNEKQEIPYLWYIRIVPTLWYFRIVTTMWYFRIVTTVWYFRIVPTVWYFLLFIFIINDNFY
jgi:hypothetical protein